MTPTILTPQETKNYWDKVCAQLQLQLTPAVFNTWILSNPITQIMLGDDNSCLVTITSPTAFHSTNLKKNLHIQVLQTLNKVLEKDCDIQYNVGSVEMAQQQSNNNFTSIKNTLSPAMNSGFDNNTGNNFAPTNIDANASLGHVFANVAPSRSVSPRVEDLFSQSNMQSASEDRIKAIARNIGLRMDYTFETFAVSTSNEMAHAAATAVSNRPGISYNPLFLYGGVGVGKTHLMHAIAHNILRNNPNVKIIYCTGEEFTNEIVQAIQQKKAGHFKSRYRGANVLLIDDIQFIAGKNAVQEEFFHTFNALTKGQAQIVLTSDRPPHEMNLLEDRLRSRFEAGLMIDIQQPSFELRTAIILVKSNSVGLNLNIDIAKHIASYVDSARKIEGVITSIRSEVELKGKLLDQSLVDNIIKSAEKEKRQSITASPSDIIKTVADHYKLKQSALKGKKRVKSLVSARHIAMYLLKSELDLPLIEIGRWFSGRDHTSIIHAVKKVEKDLNEDDEVKRDISALRMTLSAVK